MKKPTFLFLLAILVATIYSYELKGQAPPKFSYQAIVRDINAQLIKNKAVGVRISIIQESIHGNVVYAETQTPTTDAFGMINLQIGGDNAIIEHGDISVIDWSEGPFYIKSEVDPKGGDSYFIVATNQLLSVPYALHAHSAGNVFSGNYDDLNGKPELWDSSWCSIKNKPELFDSNYFALKNLPNIKDSIEAHSFSGKYHDLQNIPPAWDSTYENLKNKPELNGFATLDMNNESITNLADPLMEQDAATKAYTDKLLEYVQSLEQILVDSDLMLKDYDGNMYKAAKIGNQTWMAENLRVTHYADGTPIQQLDSSNWNKLNHGSFYCWHDYDSVHNSMEYGAYYNFSAATRGEFTVEGNTENIVQGVCPTNWHVPSKIEWEILYNYLADNGLYQILDALTSSKEINFNAKASGYYLFAFSAFQSIDSYFWRTSTVSTANPYIANPALSGGGFEVIKEGLDCFPIRCIKD